MEDANLSDLIEAFFHPHGPLSKSTSNYFFRGPQVQMANRIGDCITNEDTSLVIEASTGTGKSYAYLAAALLSGKRTIISTATKTLQDQLYQKDLPVVLKSVFELTGKRPTALVLKGRNNYLCLKKMDERAYQPGLFDGPNKDMFENILHWTRNTETGDFAELTYLPEDSPIFSALDARSEHCVGSACSFYNDCFVVKQRREAQKVDLLIVNHALLCTDGAIRAKSSQAQKDNTESDAIAAVTSQILPDFDLWIIDEAHAFADVATRNFGISLTDKDFRQLTNDLLYMAAFLSKNVQEVVKTLAIAITYRFSLFVEKILAGKSSSPIKFKDGMSAEASTALFDFLDALREMDIALIQAGQIATDYGAEMKVLSRRIHDVLVQITYISQGGAEKSGYLIVAEMDARGRSISAWPINPGHILQSHLWSLEIPVVMTSATLAFNGSTKSFCRQMGIPSDKEGLVLPPIFDFENRSALYVASHLPNPNEPDFAAASQDEIEFLVQMSLGGALILFTSHRALTEAHFALKDKFDNEQRGLKPFQELALPEAALTLKQGFGRLLRSDADAGIAALLDSRVLSKSYGRQILKTLPSMPMFTNREDLEEVWYLHIRKLVGGFDVA
jgi:ATP-dependent DNA helicase DinG